MSGLDLEAVRGALVDAGEKDPGPLEALPLPGGASRDLWVLRGAGERSYVLRRDPPGGVAQTSREGEWEVQRAAWEAGVPVPRPVVFADARGPFDTAGLVMAWVEGEAIPRRVLRDDALAAARAGLALALGRALAALRAVGVPGPARAADPAVEALAAVRASLDEAGAALPALELGLRWLELNRPPPVAPGVVHGDFRLGNFLVAPAGLRAVIDWEFWHAGDPAEDLAWVCARPWRFGVDALAVAGVGSRDALLEGFGADVAPARLRWWDVISQAKWGVYCARQAALRRTGAHASLERTVLARRVAEAEWDLLALLETT